MLNEDELNIISKIGPEVVRPVYEDGLKQGVQEVGRSVKTVTGLVNVLLMPLAVLVHGIGELEDKLKMGISERLADTPNEQIIAPQLSVVGPLLDKYKYVHEVSELADMFLNLLANSMDAHKVSETHPAFVEVIAQLAPDEARLFRNIGRKADCPKIDVAIRTVGKPGHNLLRSNFLLPIFCEDVDCPQFVPTYLDNLQRLGLIHVTSGVNQDHYIDDSLYEVLGEIPFVKNLEQSLNQDKQRIQIIKGIVSITDFGKTFSSAVTRNVRLPTTVSD